MGHYQNECPILEHKEANYVGFDEDEEVLLMAYEDMKQEYQGIPRFRM